MAPAPSEPVNNLREAVTSSVAPKNSFVKQKDTLAQAASLAIPGMATETSQIVDTGLEGTQSGVADVVEHATAPPQGGPVLLKPSVQVAVKGREFDSPPRDKMMIVSPVNLEDEVRTQAVATLVDDSAMITETTGSGPMDIDRHPRARLRCPPLGLLKGFQPQPSHL